MDIRELIPQQQLHPQQILGLWSAKIASTATSLAQTVDVIIPDIDASSLWGPCKWMPRFTELNVNVAEDAAFPDTHGDAELIPHLVPIPQYKYPSAGDDALIAFDNRRTVWVVVWWPT